VFFDELVNLLAPRQQGGAGFISQLNN